MKTITFPHTDPAGEAKLKRFLETLSDFMNVSVSTKSVIVLAVEVPEDRPDVITVIDRIGHDLGISNPVRWIVRT